MGKKVKRSSKPKFELKFTRQALDQLKEPGTKFEELSNKLEKLGIKLEEWWTKFEGLGIKLKKSWIKFKEKLKSSSSQESKIQDHNLDNDNIYVVDYVNGNYEIYHHYEQIIYNEVVPESTINWSEDSYADTSCDSFESSETGHENEFSLDVNEGASCSKIGNVEKRVPPLVPPMPSKQSIDNYHKKRNVSYLQLPIAVSSIVNEGASCSKIGNAEKKVPPAIAPKPKNWNPESASNINNLQVNDLDRRQIRQSLRKTNHR